MKRITKLSKYAKSVLAVTVMLFCYQCSLLAQTISTYAGNGISGYSGDGGPCASATFRMLYGQIAADSSGNLYIADDGNYVIRKISASGVISTFAGNGSEGYSGDGSQATTAQLAIPVGIAVDAVGNIYIGEPARIRKVTTSGIITTYAGNDTTGYSGDGGPATAAEIGNFIMSLATDGSGNLYINDGENARVRKVTPSGIITTIAGNGTAGFAGDGGPATAATLGGADFGLAADATDNLYIADMHNNRVRKITPSGIITTIAGTSTSGYSGDGGYATAAQLSMPWSLTTDASGNIYVYDWGNHRIRKISTSGIISSIAGNGGVSQSGDGGPATGAHIDSIVGMAISSSGSLYMTCGSSERVRKISSIATAVEQTTNIQAYFTVTPNPCTGNFILSYSSPVAGPAQVVITNIIGMKVTECTAKEGQDISINLNVPPGIYYITTTTSVGREIKPLIVE